jgi:hypothetical protein
LQRLVQQKRHKDKLDSTNGDARARPDFITGARSEAAVSGVQEAAQGERRAKAAGFSSAAHRCSAAGYAPHAE